MISDDLGEIRCDWPEGTPITYMKHGRSYKGRVVNAETKSAYQIIKLEDNQSIRVTEQNRHRVFLGGNPYDLDPIS